MRRLSAVLSMLLLASLLSPVGHAQEAEEPGRHREFGDIDGFWNIVPPGQDGVLNGPELLAAQGGTFPPHFNDQTPLYEGLLYAAGLAFPGEHGEPLLGVTDGDIGRFFKEASFGAPGTEGAGLERVYAPTEDLVIVRDSAFGVPHIYGETREAAMFGAGYIAGEDRLFLVDILRHLGRARLSEFLGASEANMQMDREQIAVAPYQEEDLTEQVTAICELGPEGQLACDDAEAYIAGLNAYVEVALSDPSLLPGEYPALQQMPEEFIPEDIVAIASLVGGIFGRGGGGEVASGRFLSQLIEMHGEEEGRAIWEDFRAANDPEAPMTTTRAFPYNNHDPAAIDPDSVALLDLETADETMAELAPLERLVADGPFGPIDLSFSLGMSNAILASAEVTDGEVPIAVFGPQTGYFTPQLLVEQDIHGPGIDARGVAFAGTNIYVQLGRGRGYAWSATSAGGDNVDQWVLELCNPDGSEATLESQAYMFDGECREMDVYTHRQIAKPTAGGIPDPSAEAIIFDIEVERVPDYNFSPVVARGTVDGAPVAIFEQRSTYGAELRSAIGFQRINDPDFMAGGVDAFNDAFDGVDFTFNWFYVDDEHIAYKHSCLCPIRDPRSDPDLPTWATGEWDWTGEFLAPEDQPQDVDPEQGFFANWNNKQAPEFRANDSNYSYSATYRSEFLAARMRALIASGRMLTRGDMVNIMTDAGTVDLQGQEIYPLVLEILGTDSSGDEAVDAMRDVLAQWVLAGGHRRDVDGDGTYDHAVAIAIGDAFLRPLLDAVYGEEVGEADLPERIEDHPRQGVGSSYNGGQANFLDKALRMVLGHAVGGPYSRTYCGGSVEACRTAIWDALAATAEVLTSEPSGEEAPCDYPGSYRFGSSDMDAWVYDSACDEIVQSAAGVAAAPNMQWVNRPTFQQVAQPGSRIGRVSGPSRIDTAAAVSRQAFPDGAETVVLATAGQFADAVAGTPLAAQEDAPLLLSVPETLSAVTAHEVVRLGATRAILLGGTAALTDAVADGLTELGVETVDRVSGPNRFATAAEVAGQLAESATVVVASGENFADALAAGPFAVADGRAILLTSQGVLPPETAEALDGATDVVVAGGTAAVSADVATAIEALGATVERISGPSRYDTGRAFADAAIEAGAAATTVYGVTGSNFPDALTAGAAAARAGGVLLLLAPPALDSHPAPAAFIADHAAEILRLWLVGGQVVIPPGLRADLEAALTP